MIRQTKRAMALAGVLAAMSMAGAAWGQAANPFGSFKHDADQPIEIVADSLAVDQGTEQATFTGTVEAAQGTLRMTADKIVVNYGGAGGEATGAGRIDKLRAEGNVFLSNGAETATGAWADYNVAGGNVTMGGGVVLAQGDNAVSGQKLTIDLNSGKGEISGGRVRSVFKPAAKGQ
ncbi:MAG: lipopolysaccharide export system protein LptA [Paracoccaceae bacterium]|jgi:lipopolysaccharide export system protein LptA